MKGDLTGILRFRIIGYQEMLSFLISRQLMSFALRLIKKIELKTLTDFFFLFCMTRVIYCLSSRKTCWWFVCSAWHRRVTVTSDEFTRVKMIESLHLQSAVKINEACTYSESNCSQMVFPGRYCALVRFMSWKMIIVFDLVCEDVWTDLKWRSGTTSFCQHSRKKIIHLNI